MCAMRATDAGASTEPNYDPVARNSGGGVPAGGMAQLPAMATHGCEELAQLPLPPPPPAGIVQPIGAGGEQQLPLPPPPLVAATATNTISIGLSVPP